MNVSGGELITRTLVAHGVGSVFAVAGASHTHLLAPLDAAGVRIVSSRHEAGAVGGADGYARTKGGLGVALIVADQGLPNAVGALAVAWHALSPVLLLVATPPRALVEADAGIDQDKLALVAPISKWARTVPDAARLGDYLETAIKHARSGRAGPAVLLIPEPLLSAMVDTGPQARHPPPPLPRPDPDSIAAAAALLARAERPLIVAGSGAVGAATDLRRLAAGYRIPVFMNALGRGVVAEDDVLGFPWPYAQVAAKQADVVLIVGARLTQRLGLGLPPRFDAAAKFIQVDVEPGAFHRNRRTDVPILGDAAAAVAALDVALGQLRGGRPFDSTWPQAALAPRARRIAELISVDGTSLHPLQLARAVQARLLPGSVFVADGADIATWLYGAIRIHQPRGFLDHYPMGAMGSCTALAVGAAAAQYERSGAAAPPVVLVTGDGAIGFHPLELHAAARAGLNLIVLVANDGAWGTELHTQRQAIGRDLNTQLGQLPYEQLAGIVGGHGLRIDDSAQLEPVLDRAFATPGLVVVNALIDPEAGAELKTNPDVRMIVFSDLVAGQAAAGMATAGDGPKAGRPG